jgi:hypothetical protein
MGKTQEVNGAVALASRLLDDNREGHQLLQRTSKQAHSKLDQQRTTETVRCHSHYTKEPTAAGIQGTLSHIGWENFLKIQISREWLTYVPYNEEHSNGHGKSKD